MRDARAVWAVAMGVGVAVLADPAAAHAGALSGTLNPVPVPSWLIVVTGGGVVGASFLLTSLVTDHAVIRAVNNRRVALGTLTTVHTVFVWGVRAASIAVLVAVVAIGLFGPEVAVANFGVVVVWAGWWAGYTMTTYLVGNTWPALNPWRALTALVPTKNRPYPERLGGWPSVVGLLVLVLLEVVSPVAQNPRFLAVLVVGYSVVTVAGAVVYGSETWFGVVDPISRVFRCYGRLAPLQRTGTGIEWRLPGAALAERHGPSTADETAFVVALLWVTTYDGLVATPAGGTAIRAIVGTGIPPLAVYVGVMVAGFGLFLAVYRLASRRARRTANTYITAGFVRRWFAASLLPIAAGYHLAHFLGYFLSLSPALVAVVSQPLAPPVTLQTLVLPAWFGTLQLLFVLVGHLLAVWVAHARSFSLFPGRLQPIRSQYPFVIVMVFYTMTSMWVVAQPFTPPPYI
jgi:hypothetical protein